MSYTNLPALYSEHQNSACKYNRVYKTNKIIHSGVSLQHNILHECAVHIPLMKQGNKLSRTLTRPHMPGNDKE